MRGHQPLLGVPPVHHQALGEGRRRGGEGEGGGEEEERRGGGMGGIIIMVHVLSNKRWVYRGNVYTLL